DGVTLHAASDDEFRFSDGAPAALLIDRLVMMLAALIDNRRALELRVRELRAQAIHAAELVHELRNPLTTIINYSDFLQRKLARVVDPDDVRRLASIKESGDRIERFTSDLTTYSRPTGELVPVAIGDVIDLALNCCEVEITRTGVMVQKSLGDVPAVKGAED